MRRFWNERVLYFLLAAGVAVVMWLYVATAQNPIVPQTMHVDLRLRNLSANEVVVRATPSRVTLVLEGPRSEIAQLSPKLVDASVDLSGLPPGEHPGVPIAVVLPGDVRLVKQEPATAFVVLDATATKRLPVEVSLLGTPPEGFTLGKPRASPPYVIVSGPSRQMDQVRHAVVSIDTSALRQQVLTSLQVRPVDADGREVSGVTVEPVIVGINLAVREAVISKVLPVVPTIVGEPLQGLAVTGATADPSTVTFTGPGTLLRGIDSGATAPVDVGAARADFTRGVAVQVPPGISSSVHQVTVVIHIGRGLLSTIFRAVPVRVIGLPAGTASRVEPARVDVQVEGPQDLIRTLTAQAVTIEVSAAGQRSGAHTMIPRAILPQGLHVLVIHPAQVVVYLFPS